MRKPTDEAAGRITDAQREAVVENLGLVFACVLGRPHYKRDEDDLIQEGVKGLMEAVRTHGRNPGVPFGPYATLRIKRYIHKYVSENRPIKIPLSSFKGNAKAWASVAAELRVRSFDAIREEHGGGIDPADDRADGREADEKRAAIESAIDGLPDRLREQIKCIYLDETGLRAYARGTGCDYRHLLRRRDRAFEIMRASLESQGWTIHDEYAKGA